MSQISITTLQDGTLNATDLNTPYTTIYTNHNSAYGNVNVALNANINGAKIANKTITSRKLKPFIGIINQTGAVNLTTSPQDLTGTELTFTLETESYIFIDTYFEFIGFIAGSNRQHGVLVMDGVAQLTEALTENDAASDMDTIIHQTYQIFLSRGIHVMKLQAYTNADTGTEICGTRTRYYFEVFGTL